MPTRSAGHNQPFDQPGKRQECWRGSLRRVLRVGVLAITACASATLASGESGTILPNAPVIAPPMGAAVGIQASPVSADGATASAGAVAEQPTAIDPQNGQRAVEAANEPAAFSEAPAGLIPLSRPAGARPLGPRESSPHSQPRDRSVPGVAGGKAAKGEQRGPIDESGFSALWNNHLVRTAVSLGMVIALMVAFALAGKKLTRRYAGTSLAAALGPGGASPAGVLEILGRYPVARGQSLVLLKVDRRVLLLSHSQPSARIRGAGAATFSTLAEFDDPDEVASILWRIRDQTAETLDRRFGSILRSSDAEFAHNEQPPASIQAVRGPGPSEQMRLHAATPEGDRAELWNPNAVLKVSQDGRQWMPSDTPAQMAAAAPSRPTITHPSHAESQSDPMAALRRRLTGLQGRGVQT